MSSFARFGGQRHRTRNIRRSELSGGHLVADVAGTAAIEFGILFPALMLILVGTFEFGRALQARNEMSHALSKAARVVNLDPTQTATTVTSLLGEYLDEYEESELNVAVATTTISGVDYLDISVSFPFQTLIPFAQSTITLDVDTLVPMLPAGQ